MQRYCRAYTLVEALYVMALIALLALVSLPGFRSGLAHQAGEVHMENLARTLSLARSAAVTDGVWVTVCRSADGATCGGQWEQGILVFTDHNGDRVINGDDRIIRIGSAGRVPGTLRLRSFPNRQYLQFTPLGFTRGQSGNFTWCPADADARHARQLIFIQSGRTRPARDSDGDGYREGVDGNALTCSAS